MWWLSTIFISIFGMGVLYLYADHVKHNRAEKKAQEEKINEAKRKLEEALTHAPDDLALHAALRDECLRLQGRK